MGNAAQLNAFLFLHVTFLSVRCDSYSLVRDVYSLFAVYFVWLYLQRHASVAAVAA